MPKKYPVMILLLIIGILLGGLLREVIAGKTNQVFVNFVPILQVGGDVAQPLMIKDDSSFAQVEFTYKGECLQGIPLADIVQSAVPVGNNNKILFIADDGLSAVIDGQDLEGCHLLFSDRGWEVINLFHPVSSNVKRIQEIVIIAEDAPLDYGINIITQDANLAHFTPGQLYQLHSMHVPYFEGTSTVTSGGKENSVSVYTRRYLYPLTDLVELNGDEQFLVMGGQGECFYTTEPGFLEVKDNKINYITLDRKAEIEDVKGVIMNPPADSITNLYHDALHFLQQEEKVLLIYLDGFGFHQYKKAVAEGYAPFLASLPAAVKASSVYQPVTNAGFAAMITGTTPAENGVFSRKQMELKTPSIFAKAQELGKKAALIEGHIKILNTEVEPVLNLDTNGNGSNEDEIFAAAQQYIADGCDLLLVHSHSIDDAGHTYGDFHERTMAEIKLIDGYVERLVKAWDGRVIITADHGMHTTAEGGGHGEFRYEDLFVPYLVCEGGLN
ncbi:MAG TPA: hypothetical protein DCE00_05870 [Firmicutes bacterium]|jgi:hypothetical protein|nr:hypothetical protein [Bacillota bacterium]HAA38382.1 hypothetical protein [Bacillota bacterium]